MITKSYLPTQNNKFKFLLDRYTSICVLIMIIIMSWGIYNISTILLMDEALLR